MCSVVFYVPPVHFFVCSRPSVSFSVLPLAFLCVLFSIVLSVRLWVPLSRSLVRFFGCSDFRFVCLFFFFFAFSYSLRCASLLVSHICTFPLAFLVTFSFSFLFWPLSILPGPFPRVIPFPSPVKFPRVSLRVQSLYILLCIHFRIPLYLHFLSLLLLPVEVLATPSPSSWSDTSQHYLRVYVVCVHVEKKDSCRANGVPYFAKVCSLFGALKTDRLKTIAQKYDDSINELFYQDNSRTFEKKKYTGIHVHD